MDEPFCRQTLEMRRHFRSRKYPIAFLRHFSGDMSRLFRHYSWRNVKEFLRISGQANAKTFLLISCLALDTVTEQLRPLCVSITDPQTTGAYVHHRNNSGLYVDAESDAGDLAVFRQEASFIAHTDFFYPGYYSFETVSFADHYIRLRDDGYLWIENRTYTSDYIDAASFKLYHYDTSRKYCRFRQRKIRVTRNIH